MKRLIHLVLLALLIGPGSELYAQQARNGTNAASQLLIPVDARSLGGGGAAADATGIEGVLWNPAGLDQATGDILVMLSRRNYIADIGVNFAGIGLRFGGLGTLAVSLRTFDLGTIEETDEFNMDGTGEVIEPTFFTMGVTYSRQMTDRISIGATANLVNEEFADVGGSAVTFDAGVQYRDFLSLTGLRIGVAIRNIGTTMKYDGSRLFTDARIPGTDRGPSQLKLDAADADIPTVVDIGVSYRAWQGLRLAVNYVENTFSPSEIRALATYDFYGYLTVRGSYVIPVEEEGNLENIFDGPAAGATLNLQQVVGMNLSFDYGFIPVDYFDSNHIFSLRAAF